jgi:hypothetical protein
MASRNVALDADHFQPTAEIGDLLGAAAVVGRRSSLFRLGRLEPCSAAFTLLRLLGKRLVPQAGRPGLLRASPRCNRLVVLERAMAELGRMTLEELVSKVLWDEHGDVLCRAVAYLADALMEAEAVVNAVVREVVRLRHVVTRPA